MRYTLYPQLGGITIKAFVAAVIGGLGFSLEGLKDEVDTPYGKVPLIRTRMKTIKVAFLPRHGVGHLPPHKVNYRALICAAKKSGARAVISINTVGSMAGHTPGSIFIPFAYREAAANLLTNAALDPFGKIPEFKYCAVRIEPA